MSQRIMTVNHRYLLSSVLLVVLCTGAEASAQAPPRGEPVADEWSRVFKLPGKGSLDLGNLSGEIVVVGGAGDEIRVSAVRQEGKGRRGRPEADDVRIVVNEGAGRVEIRTEHPRRGGHGDVDFTVHVPVYTDLNIRSVSGEVRIEKVQGEVRAESVSGSVTVTDVGKLQLAKSVSGEVTVSGAGGNVVNAETVSGGVEARGLTASSCNFQSVSGEVSLTGTKCGRAHVKTISGGIEYGGSFTGGGRYEFSSHSGDVRLTVGSGAGFELVAKTFSGDLQTDVPMADRSDEGGRSSMPNRRIRGTVGDGSAYVDVKTFSGSVVVTRNGASR